MECYMCDEEATTREHVPPKSFFPEEYRDNLITVPSCYTHNHENSPDIEYAKNVISVSNGTNAVAEQTFESVKRSFDRSPALFNQTFRDIEPVLIDSEELGRFTYDIARIKSVMSAVACGIYYKKYGERYTAQWNVFVTSLRSQNEAQIEPLRRLLSALHFDAQPVPQPRVFSYGIHEMVDGLIWELVFYGSFTIHCFGPKIPV